MTSARKKKLKLIKESHQDNPLGIIIQSRHISTSTSTARVLYGVVPQNGSLISQLPILSHGLHVLPLSDYGSN